MDKHKLTWVLQNNAIGSDDQDYLTRCILGMGYQVELLRVIPFIHEAADSLPKIYGPCIVYGSSGLVKLGHKENWQPCGWDGIKFELDFVNQNLGEMALNHGAIKTVWSHTFEVASKNRWKTVFLRPVSETKEFPGQVFQIDQLQEWVEKLKSSGYFEDNDNPAMIGPALELGREWRVFIVNGQQVSGCEYATNGIPNSKPFIPTEVAKYVDQTLLVFNPAPCFVIDVAEAIENGKKKLKVVEYNSINSSGFYACDKAKIVAELSNFALAAHGN